MNADGTERAFFASGHGAKWARVATDGDLSPHAVVSPVSLGFGSQVIGTTSGPQTVTLRNTGGVDLLISGIAVNGSGDFSQTNTCGTRLAPATSCTISVRFTAAASGPQSGAMTISHNAAGNPHTVLLAGTGNTPPLADVTSKCTGLACTLQGGGSSDPDGTITSYAWSFGDGATGTGATVSHTYAAAGTYTVTLTATDNGGATGTRTASVTVSNTPMHIGDLDSTRTKQSTSWTGSASITVHAAGHSPVGSAQVSGSWSTGGTSVCTTNASGVCTVAKPGIAKNTSSVVFMVRNVTSASFTYRAADNHDADADSNGTSITVPRP